MQNILYLLSKFGAVITFIILEVVCLYLVVNYNSSQRSIFLNSTSIYRGEISEEILGYDRYFNLTNINDSLAADNALLLSRILNEKKEQPALDTLSSRYSILKGKIVKNDVGRRNNHFMLDIGAKEGIRTGMGVVDSKGLLGIVTHVTKDYSLTNSILHSQTRVSATVRPYAYPGSLVWKTDDYRYMTLQSIPKHVEIAKGDTVVTNGYSTIFPKDIMVGTIEGYKIKEGQGTYEITVKLVNDVANAKMGYVIVDKDIEQVARLDSLSHE